MKRMICPCCGEDFLVEAELTERRKEILNILIEKKKPMSITEISKGINMAYNNTHKSVRILRSLGYLKTKQERNTQGQAILVALK
jgi:predicted transcriptional regulator|tara:strand:- start:1596 stop:1850 length:255 start_codon:yes stop_codon:yes gene_type:complete